MKKDKLIALLLAGTLLLGTPTFTTFARADEETGGSSESTGGGSSDSGSSSGSGSTDSGSGSSSSDSGSGSTDSGSGSGSTDSGSGSGSTDSGSTGSGSGSSDSGSGSTSDDDAADEEGTTHYPEHPGPDGDYDAYAPQSINVVTADDLASVEYIEDAEISFSSTRIEILRGTCTNLAQYVSVYPSLEKVVWSSSDSSIVSVDENGLATGVTIGSTYVCARIGTVEAHIYIVVNANSMVEETAEFPYKIYVNRSYNCVTVYTMDENGEYTVPLRSFRCSTGLKTPIGNQKVLNHRAWNALMGGTQGMWSSWIGGNFLFHSVSFYHTTHNSLKQDWYNELGTTCSGGCIRLQVINAKWIYDNIPVGTAIFLEYETSTPGPLGLPEFIPLTGSLGWDPTDPDEANPWLDGDPKIEGVKDIQVDVGEEVDYFSGVTGTDSIGSDFTDYVRVNTSVDTSTPGIYWVEYYLTDASYETVHAYAQVTVGDGGAAAAAEAAGTAEAAETVETAAADHT